MLNTVIKALVDKFQKSNGMRLGIYNFLFLGIESPFYYMSQKDCFMVVNGMAKDWEFIISGLWLLTLPPIISVKNMF